MGEFFDKIKESVTQVYNKLSTVAKIAIAASVVVVLGFLIFVASYSSEEGMVPLFPNGLSQRDFEEVTTHLENANVGFTTSDGRYVYVDNEEMARKWRTLLAMEGTVQDVPGYEIYGQEDSYTYTDDDRRKLYHAVLSEEMRRNLVALDDIDEAQVLISFPETPQVFIQQQLDNPVTAWVTITPAPYSDITESKRKIEGLRKAIAMGIDRLKPENVTIVDSVTGENLTDKLLAGDESEQIELAKRQMEHRNRELALRYQHLNNLLAKVFTPDRFILEVNLELNWDKEEAQITKRGPFVIREDDPATPYYDGEVQAYIPISQEVKVETFRGPAFIPEGSPGTEFNIPPGMKQFADRFTMYESNTTIENNEVGSEENIRRTNQPYEIDKFSVAAIVDGKWTRGEWLEEEQRFERQYESLTPEEIRKIEDTIKGYSGFNPARGDTVSVENIQYDRSAEFAKEDAEYLQDQKTKQFYMILISLLLAALIIGFVIWRFKKWNDLRKRRREEELHRQAQAMREAALRAAEEEGVMLDLSPEDKARLEMQENAITLARERPEDVAQLIRTWIAEE